MTILFASVEILRDTIESFTTWLYKVFFIVVKMGKWFCEAETSSKLYIFKIHSELYITSPHFVCDGKKPSVHEHRTFLCGIYPIPSFPKKLYYRTQEGSFMGYTNRRATMKWWYLHTKKLKDFLFIKFDEHNNKFGKG